MAAVPVPPVLYLTQTLALALRLRGRFLSGRRGGLAELSHDRGLVRDQPDFAG